MYSVMTPETSSLGPSFIGIGVGEQKRCALPRCKIFGKIDPFKTHFLTTFFRFVLFFNKLDRRVHREGR